MSRLRVFTSTKVKSGNQMTGYGRKLIYKHSLVTPAFFSTKKKLYNRYIFTEQLKYNATKKKKKKTKFSINDQSERIKRSVCIVNSRTFSTRHASEPLNCTQIMGVLKCYNYENDFPFTKTFHLFLTWNLLGRGNNTSTPRNTVPHNSIAHYLSNVY